MVFSTYEFIFLFLPIVLIGYFLLGKLKNKKIQQIFLIIASLFFYGYYNVSYLAIILISVLVNYGMSILINKQHKKWLLVLGIIFNVLLLGYFKYSNFFIDTFNHIVGTEFNLLNIILPLGISFFTFQQIAYLVGVYKKEENVEDIITYMLFVTFFPYVISGPITTGKEIMGQFKNEENRKVNYNNLAKGIYLFVIGLFKKIVIANTIALWVDNGYSSAGDMNFIATWVVILTYTLQIYFDFSGYSDMAVGIAKMFNINLPYNFNSPYKANSVREFWRRWHITLSRFLTNYIYIPLGGSRKGKIRTYINTLITFLVSGLWHGAAWTYVVWGGLHGIAIIIERVFDKVITKIPVVIRKIGTFIFISITWVFFRAENWEQVKNIFSGLVNFNVNISEIGNLAYDGIFSFPAILNVAYITVILIALLYVIFKCKNSNEKYEQFKFTNKNIIFIIILFIISVIHLNKVSTFIYFNF